MIDDEVELSAAGQRRSEQILRLALEQARTKRRRRRIVRAGVVAAIIVLSISTFNVFDRVTPAPTRIVVEHAVPTPSPILATTYIQTDPGIVRRLAIGPQRRAWTTIGDDELLDALAAAGQPAGIIYHDGEAILLPR